MNIVVAVPVDEGLASFIGKRGSADGIAFYNRRLESDVIVALFPSQEDEKVYELAESLLVASQVVLSTRSIDRKFGEALVASSLLGKRIILTDDNEVGALLKSADISKYEIAPREGLLDRLRSGAASGANELVRVDIDKAFPVKGIGTVVLGVVTRGTIRQHDRLFHTSGKEVVVRSLQSQDVDIASAERGTRVGVSLKDISDEEIRKGDLLTSKAVGRCSRVVIGYKASKAAKEGLTEGANYGIAVNFSYSECTVKSIEEAKLELELELRTALPIEAGDTVLLLRKDLPRIFASGEVKAAFV